MAWTWEKYSETDDSGGEGWSGNFNSHSWLGVQRDIYDTYCDLTINGAVQSDDVYDFSDYGMAIRVGFSDNADRNREDSTQYKVIYNDGAWKDSQEWWRFSRHKEEYTVSCWMDYWGEVVDGIGAAPSGLSGELYITATIPALDYYTISYELNGGEGNFPDQKKYAGERLYLHSEVPTKFGYEFAGWKSNQGGSYVAGDWTEWDVSQTLTAQWIPKLYECVFNGNGGVVEGVETKSYLVKYNETCSLPHATRKNYKFVGWNYNQDGSGGWVQDAFPVYGHTYLYAIWELSGNAYIKDNGTYKTAKMLMKVDGKYQTGIVYVKENGVYKKTTV